MYMALIACPNIVPSNIPVTPNFRITKNIMLNITVSKADKKLPWAYLKLLPRPLDICKNNELYIEAIKFIVKYILYVFFINGDIIINIIIEIKHWIVTDMIEEDIMFLVFVESFLDSTSSLNTACSTWNVIMGINKDTKVFNRSTVPNSSVDKIPVYSGSNKNVINLVQILPMESIMVFFISFFSLLILSPIFFSFWLILCLIL